MSRSSKKGHEPVGLRRIGVLGRSCAKHTALPASLSGLPYGLVDVAYQREGFSDE
jgi:hypothetical protein